MGRVMAKVKLTNQTDVDNKQRGLISPERVRTVEVEGLVDTGATSLVIPAQIAIALGLSEIEQRTVRYADGRRAKRSVVGPLQIEILGRKMVGEAVMEPMGTQVLIGQIPLEALDLIVDPSTRDVQKNPRSPDLAQNDLLGAA